MKDEHVVTQNLDFERMPDIDKKQCWVIRTVDLQGLGQTKWSPELEKYAFAPFDNTILEYLQLLKIAYFLKLLQEHAK